MTTSELFACQVAILLSGTDEPSEETGTEHFLGIDLSGCAGDADPSGEEKGTGTIVFGTRFAAPPASEAEGLRRAWLRWQICGRSRDCDAF